MSFFYPVWISLLNIVKKWAVRTKLSLVPFYCFLFFPESVKETIHTNIRQIFWCSKLLKYYNKRETTYDSSYCFFFHILLSYLSLWNESDSFLQDSIRYLDDQNCWNIKTKRGRWLDVSNCFLFHLFVSYFESLKLFTEFSSRFD